MPIRAVIFSLFVVLQALNGVAAPVQLTVSPDGTDDNPGTAEAPLASIEGARDRLRVLRDSGELTDGAVVTVTAGVYRIEKPITFLPADSGTEVGPIIYRADTNAEVVISGGRPVHGWKQEGDFWVTILPNVESGDWSFSNLWVNGERRQPARTPNPANSWGDEPPDSDFFAAAGPVMVKNPETGNEEKSNMMYHYREGDLSELKRLDDAIVVTFHSWATSLMRVKNVDRENRILEFTGPARWPYGRWQPDQRYFIEHLFEGLDQPGEWYLNRSSGKLYYYPMPGETFENTEVIAPVAQQLLVLYGEPESRGYVEHLQFDGLTFQHTEYPIAPEGHSDAQAAFRVHAAVEFTGARYCTIENATIAHLGNYGVWFRRGSQHNTLRHSEVTDLGAGGVRIGEGSSPATPGEATRHNRVDNNFIHEGGRVFRSAVGVWIGRSSYNEVTHNEICDFRYTGVSVGWSWGYAESSAHHNIIASNHIHHIGRGQLNDMGGIYCLGVSPGTILRGNRIHDVISHPRLYGGWGLYTDEGSTGILLENNLVYNTTTGGFHQHYGRDNVVRNNIFAFSHGPQIIRTREEGHNSFTFKNNIVYFNTGRALGSNWNNGNWRMDHNVYWDTAGNEIGFSGRNFETWQSQGNDHHSLITDPGFVDGVGGDFRLKANAPALTTGFQPFDFSRAGLYGEEAWIAKPESKKRPAFTPPPAPEKDLRGEEKGPSGTFELISVEKIWSSEMHSAFTGLVRWRDMWYCTFREADGHVKGNGNIRVIRSSDGVDWESCGLLTETGIDLRDPKLSVTPDDRLMLSMGGSVYEGKNLVGRQPRSAFSEDGTTWTAPIPVMANGDWLWRVTWHEGKAYGVSYRSNLALDPADKKWELDLVVSEDGINFESIAILNLPGRPNETTLRFMPDGECIALVRREAGNRHAWIGSAKAPYTEWTWHDSGIQVGGPEFMRLPDGRLVAGGRRYPGGAKMYIGWMTREGYAPQLEFPSGGDCSYPSMVWHDDQLWVSYYSSHEGESSIYLARVKIGSQP